MESVAGNVVIEGAQGVRLGQPKHGSARAEKNETKPWLVERFCIPPEKNAAFVKCMEDVLDVYHRPYDPEWPQVCLDETSKQLLAHTRKPVPAAPGTAARIDDEYKRCGTANVFAAVEPLTGRCVVEVTEDRTQQVRSVRGRPQGAVVKTSEKLCALCPSLAHETLALEIKWEGGSATELILCLPCGIGLTEGEPRVLARLKERGRQALN